MQGECELCGREAQLTEVELEGTLVLACEKCASLGKKAQKPRSEQKPYSRWSEPEETIVSNYGRIIKEKREKLGLTQEELAKKIMEKSGLIAKIEREEITPTLELARKLERALDIKLIEKLNAETIAHEEREIRDKTVLTLGDLIKIKRK